MKRKNEVKDKECRTKKSFTKKTMNEKDKLHRIVPYTERNASGRNWNIFKNIVLNSASIESNNSSKENVQKKSVPHNQKSRKKYHVPPINVKEATETIEDTVDIKKKQKLTKEVAMDCEMVGIGDGTESMLARVSIVNRYGYCIYDKYVKPREPVQDYRTKISGIRPHNLQNGDEFQMVQQEVAEILKGRVLVGHALKHDLDVLYLSHPKKHLRDTSTYKRFRQLSRGNTPGLKKLAFELLGREIQKGEHSSIEDAKAAMQLYVLYKNMWESEFYSKR